MRGLRIFVCFVFVVMQNVAFAPRVFADDTETPILDNDVVISQMYPGATGNSDQEFVEIFNNTKKDIDVTNWCLRYHSSTGKTTKDIGCFAPAEDHTTLWLPGGGYAVFASQEMNEIVPHAEGYFASGISIDHGYIELFEGTTEPFDTLGWGDLDAVAYPGYQSASAPNNGFSLHRQTIDFHLQDTDNDGEDFRDGSPLVHTSNVYEQQTIVDTCPNIPDIQAEIPYGQEYDEVGNCQPDSCLNIDGLQVNIPEGYESDYSGNCMVHDECGNLEGVQGTIPGHMVRGDDDSCIIQYSPLILTEILPNAVGRDNGNEFVEIYNPGDEMIDLTFYTIQVGNDSDDIYSFPVGSTIGPGEYRTFSDSQMKFTLVNTSSRVRLTAVGGAIFGDTGQYVSADEGESWALIAGGWEYTNRPTPGSENLVSIANESAEADSESSSSSLQPCATDQFRNPETNRCKKIKITTYKPCDKGQYRSLETNRCRSVLGASTSSLKPCKVGQYRSPDTNRCRKKQAGEIPKVAFAIQPTKDSSAVFVGWWALGGVGLLAAGYGVWEWRREIGSILRKLLHR